jgi:Cu+-exporting ATPase
VATLPRSRSVGHRKTATTTLAELPTEHLSVVNMKQNLTFAFVYNALAAWPAAAVLFSILGWLLSHMVAARAVSLSSVPVITNALRLRVAVRRQE